MTENVLNQWAAHWRLSPEAMADLRARLVLAATPAQADDYRVSEAAVQAGVRLEAAYRGDTLLFRNNVGALKDERGVPVRYGLANESKRINNAVKSADLIGVYRRLIVPGDVGHVIGQFVSIETKRADWTRKNDSHTEAQTAWATLINQYGGYATIFNGGGQALAALPVNK